MSSQAQSTEQAPKKRAIKVVKKLSPSSAATPLPSSAATPSAVSLASSSLQASSKTIKPSKLKKVSDSTEELGKLDSSFIAATKLSQIQITSTFLSFTDERKVKFLNSENNEEKVEMLTSQFVANEKLMKDSTKRKMADAVDGECPICTEKFSKRVRKAIKCLYCSVDVCSSCTETYLLSKADAHCMNCRKLWPKEFLKQHFSKVFVFERLVNHYGEVLSQLEKSMFPLTMEEINSKEMKNQLRNLEAELTSQMDRSEMFQRVLRELKNMETNSTPKASVRDTSTMNRIEIVLRPDTNSEFYKHFVMPATVRLQQRISDAIQQFTMPSPEVVDSDKSNTFNANTKDFKPISDCLSALSDLRNIRNTIWNTLSDLCKSTNNNQARAIGVNEIKLVFNCYMQAFEIITDVVTKSVDKFKTENNLMAPKRCPKNKCPGYLTLTMNSEAKVSNVGECKVCRTLSCTDCLEELKPYSTHKCDPDLVKTIKLIQRDSKPCPNCKQPVSKTDGCFSEDTLIPLYSSSSQKSQKYKVASEIQVGDELQNVDGSKCVVEHLIKGHSMMYSVSQTLLKSTREYEDQGAISYKVNGDHLLVLLDERKRQVLIQVREFVKLSKSIRDNLFGYRADGLLTKLEVTLVGEDNFYGWKLASPSNGLFQLSDGTVVHNCDQMFCVGCNTAFDWQSNEVITGRMHNPHYFAWRDKLSAEDKKKEEQTRLQNRAHAQQQNNQNTNENNQDELGGCEAGRRDRLFPNSSNHLLGDLLSLINGEDFSKQSGAKILVLRENYQFFSHIIGVDMTQHQVEPNPVQRHARIRREFLSGRISESSWKRSLTAEMKTAQFNHEVYQLLDAIVTIAWGIYEPIIELIATLKLKLYHQYCPELSLADSAIRSNNTYKIVSAQGFVAVGHHHEDFQILCDAINQAYNSLEELVHYYNGLSKRICEDNKNGSTSYMKMLLPNPDKVLSVLPSKAANYRYETYYGYKITHTSSKIAENELAFDASTIVKMLKDALHNNMKIKKASKNSNVEDDDDISSFSDDEKDEHKEEHKDEQPAEHIQKMIDQLTVPEKYLYSVYEEALKVNQQIEPFLPSHSRNDNHTDHIKRVDGLSKLLNVFLKNPVFYNITHWYIAEREVQRKLHNRLDVLDLLYEEIMQTYETILVRVFNQCAWLVPLYHWMNHTESIVKQYAENVFLHPAAGKFASSSGRRRYDDLFACFDHPTSCAKHVRKGSGSFYNQCNNDLCHFNALMNSISPSEEAFLFKINSDSSVEFSYSSEYVHKNVSESSTKLERLNKVLNESNFKIFPSNIRIKNQLVNRFDLIKTYMFFRLKVREEKTVLDFTPFLSKPMDCFGVPVQVPEWMEGWLQTYTQSSPLDAEESNCFISSPKYSQKRLNSIAYILFDHTTFGCHIEGKKSSIYELILLPFCETKVEKWTLKVMQKIEQRLVSALSKSQQGTDSNGKEYVFASQHVIQRAMNLFCEAYYTQKLFCIATYAEHWAHGSLIKYMNRFTGRDEAYILPDIDENENMSSQISITSLTPLFIKVMKAVFCTHFNSAVKFNYHHSN